MQSKLYNVYLSPTLAISHKKANQGVYAFNVVIYIYICIFKRIKWFSHILKQTETFAAVHCSYHNGTQAKRMDSLVHLDNTKKAALARCIPVHICLITMYAIHQIHRFFVCVHNGKSQCMHMDCTQLQQTHSGVMHGIDYFFFFVDDLIHNALTLMTLYKSLNRIQLLDESKFVHLHKMSICFNTNNKLYMVNKKQGWTRIKQFKFLTQNKSKEA